MACPFVAGLELLGRVGGGRYSEGPCGQTERRPSPLPSPKPGDLITTEIKLPVSSYPQKSPHSYQQLLRTLLLVWWTSDRACGSHRTRLKQASRATWTMLLRLIAGLLPVRSGTGGSEHGRAGNRFAHSPGAQSLTRKYTIVILVTCVDRCGGPPPGAGAGGREHRPVHRQRPAEGREPPPRC